MAKVSGMIDVPVMIGVGAAFDFLAGTKPAAPRWMSKMGLEWLFRLASEPRRLWKRYLIGNSKFVGLSVRDFLRSPKASEDPSAS
jgi:N-acetylglucosaminyldiphosphoundecaprenol N-acetyl-beta-D-mannosaminyltransferase